MKKNKGTALVTGAAVRVGRAIALRLAEQGYNIALHYNGSSKDAQKTKQDIEKKKVFCQLFACDLSRDNQVSSLIVDVKNRYSDLNILVNSASIFEKSSLSSWDQEHYDRHWNINFKAPFILTSEFAKVCKSGQIINILDTSIVKNKTSNLIYLLTKKSLHELTKLSAIELAPKFRVNAIAPGAILPPPGEGNEYLKKRAKMVPLKAYGNPEQIADCVAFLVNSPYITGQVIFNDGGEHLS